MSAVIPPLSVAGPPISSPVERFALDGGPPTHFRLDGVLALDERIDFTRASNGRYIDASGTLQTAANNVPRFDHDASGNPLGLLIEEARTQEARSPDMSGAVVGNLSASGSLPTSWVENLIGFSIAVDAIGTEDGYPYIDVTISGTNTSGSNQYPKITFQGTSDVAAALAEVWSGSVHVKYLEAAPTDDVRITIVERTAGGSFLAGAADTIAVSEERQRFVQSKTLAEATVGRVSFELSLQIVDTETGLAKLRIYDPQLEKGAFASSLILGPGGPITRAADVATITGTNFSDWFPTGSFSWVVKGRTAQGIGAGQQVIGIIDDGTTNNRVLIQRTSSTFVSVVIVSGGVTVASLGLGNITDDTDFAVAVRVEANNFAASLDGAAVVTDAVGTIPVGLTTKRFGQNTTGFRWFGTIASDATYPNGLSDAQLQALAA